MSEPTIALNDVVAITKGDTYIAGPVDGIKLVRGELERVSFEHLDAWFWLSDGWKFLVVEEEESEVTDGSVQPE